MKPKQPKRKSDKGKLVKGYIPPISIEFLQFDVFKKQMKEILKDNAGIYVLYKDKDIYYVGLATNLYWRLHDHMKDKHKDKWNKFCAFIVGHGDYLKDMESMVHMISEPPANVFRGKFKQHYEYDKKIRKMVNDVSSIVKKIERER